MEKKKLTIREPEGIKRNEKRMKRGVNIIIEIQKEEYRSHVIELAKLL